MIYVNLNAAQSIYALGPRKISFVNVSAKSGDDLNATHVTPVFNFAGVAIMFSNRLFYGIFLYYKNSSMN